MYTTVEAAVTLHNRLLQHMLRLPKAFFDTNPAGEARRCLMTRHFYD
jgi:ABC-type bacteriocin/lantibiotic exporter with double-glycine peptidase domain